MGYKRFKIGDKVRCIDNRNMKDFMTVGKVYIVIDVYEHIIRVIMDNGSPNGLYSNRFELESHKDKFIELKRYIEKNEGDFEEILKLFERT